MLLKMNIKSYYVALHIYSNFQTFLEKSKTQKKDNIAPGLQSQMK